MSVTVSISAGSARGAAATYGVSSRGSDKLIFRERGSVGCIAFFLLLLGLTALAILKVVPIHPEGSLWGLLALLPFFTLFAWCVWGFHQQVLNRKDRTITTGTGILFFLPREKTDISTASSVVVERKTRTHHSSDSGPSQTTTTFDVGLSLGEGGHPITHGGEWETAVAVAEAVAHFLQLPIEDREQGITRAYTKLDRPLLQAQQDGERPVMPEACKVTSATMEGGARRYDVPRPREHCYLAMAAFAFVFWTIPVACLGGGVVALLPLAVLLPSWIKTAFGYRAEITVQDQGLSVRSGGLLLSRHVFFPYSELEEIALISLEWGGARSALAQVFGSVLVARSDRESIRFGYGLSRQALGWLQAELCYEIGKYRFLKQEETLRFEVPIFPFWRWPLLGMLGGAMLGQFTGAPLQAGLAVPFLEHVLNLGGALGFALGCLLGKRRPLAFLLSLVACAFILAGEDALLQPVASFDEWHFLKSSAHHDRTIFWIGWVATLVCFSPLWAQGVVLLLVYPWRARRRLWRLRWRILAGSAATLGLAGLVLTGLYWQEVASGCARYGLLPPLQLQLFLDPSLTQGERELLHVAARNGNVRTVRHLLASGIPVDRLDRGLQTPLMRASSRGHVRCAEVLLDAGAGLETADRYSRTPLHHAVHYREVVGLLLKRGADPNAIGEMGRTIIFQAAPYGKPEIIRQLVQHGANLNHQDDNGNTVLHRMAEENWGVNPVVIPLLLELEADPGLRNKRGLTPVEFAQSRNNTGAVNLLQPTAEIEGGVLDY